MTLSSLALDPPRLLTAVRRLDAVLAAGGPKVLLAGAWGLEREGLRVDSIGHPARTPHPFPPEDGAITVDFAEAQAELVTSPQPSPEAAWRELSQAIDPAAPVVGDRPLRHRTDHIACECQEFVGPRHAPREALVPW